MAQAPARFGVIFKDRNGQFTPKKGDVYNVKSFTSTSKGKPVRLFLYTWNNVLRRFQHWGYSDESVTLPFSAGDLPPELEGRFGWGDKAPRGGSDDPFGLGEWLDPAGVPDPAESPDRDAIWDVPHVPGRHSWWEWFRPDGCRLMYSGNKEDHLFSNPDLGAGNTGIRQGGYIDATWDIGESAGRHEVFVGCQIIEAGAHHGGVPNAYWDLAGRAGYNWWFHLGQKLQIAIGASMNFQWTNDDDADSPSQDQTNPSGETSHDNDWLDAHHVNMKAGITVKWENADFFGFSDTDFIITVDVDQTGDVRGGIGVSWGF